VKVPLFDQKEKV